MFTDIVGSTAQAAAVGDQQWRRLLDRHDQIATAEVDRYHGNFVKGTGDGILATFDAPTRALRCAFGLNDALADVGLTIRYAVHTGEMRSAMTTSVGSGSTSPLEPLLRPGIVK